MVAAAFAKYISRFAERQFAEQPSRMSRGTSRSNTQYSNSFIIREALEDGQLPRIAMRIHSPCSHQHQSFLLAQDMCMRRTKAADLQRKAISRVLGLSVRSCFGAWKRHMGCMGMAREMLRRHLLTLQQDAFLAWRYAHIFLDAHARISVSSLCVFTFPLLPVINMLRHQVLV